MSDFVEMTPEARWKHLRDNGTKSLVNLQSHQLIDERPKWFDEKRFAKAKDAIQKFYVGVLYSHFTGLLLILQLPDGLEPLLSTGNSKDIPSLYKRYLNTILHVTSWYDDDVFNPETKGYKSIRQVRAMHRGVQGVMNDKFTVLDVNGKPRLWLNQYDVAMTQFAFIGLAMLYPKKSAMIAANHEELEDINYYWRVLGYLMGIDDEFNSCQFEKYEDIFEFNRLIFEHEYKVNLKSMPCKKGLEMTQSICLALNYFMPLVTFNNLAHWWNEQFQFNSYEPQPMSAREKVLDCFTKISFNHLLKYGSFLRISNKLHRKRFDKRLKNKDKVYEKLKVQYKDSAHLTYYSDRVDYSINNNNKAISDEGIIGTTAVKVPVQKSNNNNDSEPVNGKGPIEAGGCPFGYGVGMIASVNNETIVAS